MSDVLVAFKSATTKRGFVDRVLTQYADLFEKAEKKEH